MEYIKGQFLEQPIKVQKVFLDHWQPSYGDLFCTLDRRYDFKIDRIEAIFDDSTLIDIQENKGYYKPLLTEGQLRKFIEDKLEQIYYENDGRKIELDITHNNNFTRIEEGLSTGVRQRVTWVIEDELGKKYDLLQAYWKVALDIAKESIDNDKDQGRKKGFYGKCKKNNLVKIFPYENCKSCINTHGKTRICKKCDGKSDYDELYNADLNCVHEIKCCTSGGIKCVKCGGWFCY